MSGAGTRDDETTRVGVPAEERHVGCCRPWFRRADEVRISGAGEEDRFFPGALEWPLSSAELEDLRVPRGLPALSLRRLRDRGPEWDRNPRLGEQNL